MLDCRRHLPRIASYSARKTALGSDSVCEESDFDCFGALTKLQDKVAPEAVTGFKAWRLEKRLLIVETD